MITWLLPIALAEQPKYRPSDEERGEDLYRRHCVQCHGARNGGDGPVAEVLLATVPPLVGKVEPTEPQLSIVLYGQGHMPGFEAAFHKADAIRVLKYMKSLGPDKALLTLAEKRRLEAEEKRDNAKVRARPVPVKGKPAGKEPEELAPEELAPEGPEAEGPEADEPEQGGNDALDGGEGPENTP